MKAELNGHEFDLDALVGLFPSGPIRVVRENGVHYLLADEIGDRPQRVQYYEVAPKLLERVNGLARVANSAYQPVELSGYYLEGAQRHVVVKPGSVVIRVRVGTPRVVVTGSDGVVQAPPASPGPQRAAVATTHPDVTEALAIMGQPVALGWIELYKVFEIVGDSVKPNTLDKIGLASASELRAFRASANRPDVSGADARHARISGGLPKNHMSLPKDASSSATSWGRGLTRSADTTLRWLYSGRATERDTAGTTTTLSRLLRRKTLTRRRSGPHRVRRMLLRRQKRCAPLRAFRLATDEFALIRAALDGPRNA
jgi:hypothetical protein